jgi:hypothetical protein
MKFIKLSHKVIHITHTVNLGETEEGTVLEEQRVAESLAHHLGRSHSDILQLLT